MAKEKKLLSAFGDRYFVFENNGGYCLYDKQVSSKRSNYKFLGKFYISTNNKKYIFNDDEYIDVNSLILAMDEYNKTLPFDTEIYDPMYRKHCRIEYALHDYLKSLGFTMSWEHNEPIYCLNNIYGEPICEVGFECKEDTTEGKIIKYIKGNDKYTSSYIEVPFDGLDDAIGACNSFLSSYLLTLNSKSINVIDNLTKSRTNKMLKNTFDFTTLTEHVEDEKKHLIECLEKELETLKKN